MMAAAASPVPATYEELLRGAGAPGVELPVPYQQPVPVPATYEQLLQAASGADVPTTYEELLQGTGASASRSFAGPQPGVSDRLARLEQELSGAGINGAGAPSAQKYAGGQPELLDAYNQLLQSHTELVKAHNRLLQSHSTLVAGQQMAASSNGTESALLQQGLGPPSQVEVAGRIGIVRLDGPLYTAPDDKSATLSAVANSASPDARGNKVFYQRVEGYTFEVCTAGFQDIVAASAGNPVFEKEGVVKIRGHARDIGHMFVPSRRAGPWNAPRPRRPTRTEPWLSESGADIGVQYIYDSATVMTYLKEALLLLEEECNVYCITSACGFMANLQQFCAQHSKVPCLMSAGIHLLPMVDTLTPRDSYILVLSMNSEVFSAKYDSLIQSHWDINKDSRLLVVGLQDTPAFGPDATAGSILNCEQAVEAIVAEARKAIDAAKPKGVLAILSECTELPGYTNALRREFQCPVYDAITACNMLINARAPREDYSFDSSYG